MAAEAQKCQMGAEKVLNDQVTCSSISSKINSGGNPAGSTVLAIERALKGKYKNPYGAIMQALEMKELKKVVGVMKETWVMFY